MSHHNKAKLPASQRTQPACANCTRLLVHEEYACPAEYYCAFGDDIPPRPVAVIPESARKFITVGRKTSVAIRTWNTWRKGRKVQPSDICNDYAQKESK